MSNQLNPAKASSIPSVKGLPWWAAVLLALIPVVVGAIVDLSGVSGTLSSSSLGWGFRILSIAGCVLAVLAIQRQSIFTAMVQPPLVIVVGLALGLLMSSNVAFSLTSAAVYIATFPTMAIATGATVIIGLIRLFTQRIRGSAPANSPVHV